MKTTTDTTLREVVRQVQALFQLQGARPVDERTGAYAQARSKLPLSMLHKALAASAAAALGQAPDSIADGTEYPSSSVPR